MGQTGQGANYTVNAPTGINLWCFATPAPIPICAVLHAARDERKEREVELLLLLEDGLISHSQYDDIMAELLRSEAEQRAAAVCAAVPHL